jgi:methionine-rich copper-binding protein CopC
VVPSAGIRRAVLAAGVGAAVFLALLSSALAHSRPVRFDPNPGQILERPPSEVQGWFSNDIRRADASFIRVLDEGGERVDAGAVTLSPDRRLMSVQLRPALPAGRYIVYWSTLDDDDGDTVAGCYVFFVGSAAAEAAVRGGLPLDAGSRCPAIGGEEQEAVGEQEDSDGGVPVWGLVLGIAAGAVVGAAGGRLLARR